jgi:hypothetical protein
MLSDITYLITFVSSQRYIAKAITASGATT